MPSRRPATTIDNETTRTDDWAPAIPGVLPLQAIDVRPAPVAARRGGPTRGRWWWAGVRYPGATSASPGAECRRRAAELLEFARLVGKADAKVETLSGGMKRRLTIARSLISEPDLLLLDEPTTGLDPQARHVLWDRSFRLKHNGVTLVVSTHYTDEAGQLRDRLVVMDGGRIVAQ
ncbi:MAG TPA: ATP-binding cassette domain-containing protein, partial [Nakamurella sp.]